MTFPKIYPETTRFVILLVTWLNTKFYIFTSFSVSLVLVINFESIWTVFKRFWKSSEIQDGGCITDHVTSSFHCADRKGYSFGRTMCPLGFNVIALMLLKLQGGVGGTLAQELKKAQAK